MAGPVDFQRFLLKLSKELSHENIQEVKFLLLPDEHEDEPSTGVELFHRLQKHKILNENKVDVLIEVLRDINRNDLADKLRNFKGERGDQEFNVTVAASNEAKRPMEHDEGVQNTSLEEDTPEKPYDTYASENLSTGFVLDGDKQSKSDDIAPAAHDDILEDEVAQNNAATGDTKGNSYDTYATENLSTGFIIKSDMGSNTNGMSTAEPAGLMDEPKSSHDSRDNVQHLSISSFPSKGETLYLQGPMDQGIASNVMAPAVKGIDSQYKQDQFQDFSTSTPSTNSNILAASGEMLMDEPLSSIWPLSHPRGIDQGSLDSSNVELHDYQKWLADPSLKKANTIICCPTGSGKTLTAAHICYELRKEAKTMNNEKAFKTVFIVPTRNLKQQQMDNFKMMPFESNALELLDDMADVLEIIKARDVVFMTAKVLVNALQYTRLQITDLNLIIMDECHHTAKGHPYNELMQDFYLVEKGKQVDQRGSLPQILGLTATLGVGKGSTPVDHIIKMCANLDCKSVTHLTKEEHLKELEMHRPPLKADEIRTVISRSPLDPFLQILQDTMDHICRKYEFKCEHAKGSQGYENWTVEMRKNAESAQNWEHAAAASFLKMYTNAIECTYDLRRRDGLRLIETQLLELCPEGQVTQPWEDELKHNLDEKMEELRELCRDKEGDDNPMGTELVELLTKLTELNPDARGLILTRTKYSTQALLDFINESNLPNVRVGRIIGQGQGGEDSQTDKRQLKVLDDFRNGIINVLVGTDVVQEGLDVPRCNFVIRYNFVSNEIGSVQGKGRARHVNSVCYLIVPKGSNNERRERENALKVELMNAALKELDREDRGILEEKIRKTQRENWNEYLLKQREKETRPYKAIPDVVTLFHKGKCGVELCKGSDIIKKGSDYICIAPSFIKDIAKETTIRRENFRYDSLIGAIECKRCGKRLGMVKEYKSGKRRKGHVLANKSVMYSINGNPSLEHIKQWSKVGWKIEEETLD